MYAARRWFSWNSTKQAWKHPTGPPLTACHHHRPGEFRLLGAARGSGAPYGRTVPCSRTVPCRPRPWEDTEPAGPSAARRARAPRPRRGGTATARPARAGPHRPVRSPPPPRTGGARESGTRRTAPGPMPASARDGAAGRPARAAGRRHRWAGSASRAGTALRSARPSLCTFTEQGGPWVHNHGPNHLGRPSGTRTAGTVPAWAPGRFPQFPGRPSGCQSPRGDKTTDPNMAEHQTPTESLTPHRRLPTLTARGNVPTPV